MVVTAKQIKEFVEKCSALRDSPIDRAELVEFWELQGICSDERTVELGRKLLGFLQPDATIHFDFDEMFPNDPGLAGLRSNFIHEVTDRMRQAANAINRAKLQQADAPPPYEEKEEPAMRFHVRPPAGAAEEAETPPPSYEEGKTMQAEQSADTTTTPTGSETKEDANTSTQPDAAAERARKAQEDAARLAAAKAARAAHNKGRGR